MTRRPWWDEHDGGTPSRRIGWERDVWRGDPPPAWMPTPGPQGRRPAWQAAATLRFVALLVVLAAVATAACIWSLGGLR